MSKVSTLSAILSGDDVEIVGWHIDGIRQKTMAEWLGVTERTIINRLNLIRRTLAGYGLSLPESPVLATDTKCIRRIDPSGHQIN